MKEKEPVSAASARGSRNVRIRLVYIVSIHVRWHHLEWMCEGLDRDRFEISFILVCINGRTPHMQSFLEEQGIPYERIDCRLNPWSVASTIAAIARSCRRERVDLVHTHIYFASLVGLLGAALARVPVRLNTRHHLLQNHGKPTIWLDRMTNALATGVIATSELVRRVLIERERAAPRKVHLIHLGIDLSQFRDVENERVARLARKYGSEGQGPVVGVVARHIESKGVQYAVPAFRRLLDDEPSAFLVLAFAVGPYREKIREQLAGIPADRYVEIEFEADVFALYQLFDLCVHVPTGEELETFGLVYLEALAAGIPSIFTLSGVGPEFLRHRQNAWVVKHESSEEIYQGMVALLADAELRRHLVRQGHASVDEAFSVDRMVRETQNLYLRSVDAVLERKEGLEPVPTRE